MAKKKVLVGLSGGVDSAVCAHLLQQQGYDVIAGFMKNYAEPSNPQCHTREDRNMALKVASHLGIKTFIIFDFREEYRTRIIDYIYAGYKAGRTPNPDVLCNSLVKFDIFLEKALELGCDYVATGHYAGVCEVDGLHTLIRGVDPIKDQSYFLSQLNQSQLSSTLLPLQGLHKDEIRAIAQEIGLPNAERPDSQGLCFIGDVPIAEFLKKELPQVKGDVLNVEGEVVGHHHGAYYYTLGQRHGFQTNFRAYVCASDVENNTITVVDDREDDVLYTTVLGVDEWHRIAREYALPCSLAVKIRYRQRDPVSATLSLDVDGKLLVTLDEKQWAVAPGQFVVAYDGDIVVGSGVIK